MNMLKDGILYLPDSTYATPNKNGNGVYIYRTSDGLPNSPRKTFELKLTDKDVSNLFALLAIGNAQVAPPSRLHETDPALSGAMSDPEKTFNTLYLGQWQPAERSDLTEENLAAAIEAISEHIVDPASITSIHSTAFDTHATDSAAKYVNPFSDGYLQDRPAGEPTIQGVDYGADFERQGINSPFEGYEASQPNTTTPVEEDAEGEEDAGASSPLIAQVEVDTETMQTVPPVITPSKKKGKKK